MRGVGLVDSTTFNGISVSYAGGGEINVDGYDFNAYAASNIPYMTTSGVGQTVVSRGPDFSGKWFMFTGFSMCG